MRKTWYPVRCCCQPQKVFGFMLLPTDATSLSVKDREGQAHPVEIKEIVRGGHPLVLEVVGRDLIDIVAHVERAVYSDDRPLEFWRTIPDFIEAKP